MNKVIVFSRFKSLLLLLFVFSSFGVNFVDSFGMNQQNDEGKNIDPTSTEEENNEFSVAPRNIYLWVPYLINKISKKFVDVNSSADNGTIAFFFTWLGIVDAVKMRYNDKNNLGVLMLFYGTGNIGCQSFYRGIWSARPCSRKINKLGCDFYFGVGDVTSPYLGGFLNLAFVCKPHFSRENFTIHIFDFKPLNFLLGIMLNIIGMRFLHRSLQYVRPQWIVGFMTFEIKYAKYYNISLNVGSWIIDSIKYIIYTKKAKEATENKIE